MDKICLVRNRNAHYPDKQNLLDKENDVYRMIREGFRLLGLDRENFGTDAWNPLKAYIKPGDHVLIKPNMVLHFNAYGGGTDCLYTHPSLVAAVIEYVLIALGGSGKITVGDAPLQECVFERLVEDSGYDLVIEHYRKLGVDISLIDFRNVKTTLKDGLHHLQEGKKDGGVLVHVDENSAFSQISQDRAQRLRITNYDPRILQKHHTDKMHEYMVAKEVLDADVIINMPKPKTHRKAGVTISLKNLVGINANKEFLPHHTIGAKDENGDAYLEGDKFLALANEVLDIKNMLVNEGEFELAKLADELYGKLRSRKKGERYWEGSWYGNDTIWRTIVDLNRILLYADKSGNLQKDRQRKLFIIGDMVISGELEGPLDPSPINADTIVMGDDPVAFDRTVCSIMGFDYHDIPSVEMPGQEDKMRLFSTGKDPEVVSNDDEWDGNSLIDIKDNHSIGFSPSRGWVAKLGNPRLSDIIKRIKDDGNRVYVFGAAENGRFIATELIGNGIKVEAIVDNNPALQGTEPVEGIRCISPNDMDTDIPVVITVKMSFFDEVKKQLEIIRCKVIGCI